MEFKPHGYQNKAIQHVIDNPKCGLFLDMGLGKTVSTLTAIDILKFDYFSISKVLVIAPLRVAEDTWVSEVEKWNHLQHLKIAKILGTPKMRRKALVSDADIYITNRENVPWLCDELSSFGEGWLFDMIVIDELSSFKNGKSKRFKSLKKYISSCKRVVGLTGTPAPNSLLDLWSQLYLLDQGERLGKTITGYKERYFSPDKRNATTIFSYKIKDGTEYSIKNKISDICLSMKAEDWLDMPDKIINTQMVNFEDKEQQRYLEFEKNQYLAFLDTEVTAVSKAVLINKLLQFSNGALYTDDEGYQITSNAKLDRLEEVVELANGKPVLCFYIYKHDLERIKEKFKHAVKLGDNGTNADIDSWNKGEISLLLAHPASAGHGLNLQFGGSTIVWFGLTWSLELYQQANARLYRQGQNESVIIHHILTESTMDTRVLDSLENRTDVQDTLLEALKFKYGG